MRARTAALSLLGMLALLLALLAAGLMWLGRSESGLRWSVDQLVARAGGTLTIEGVEGALGTSVRAKRVVFVRDDKRVVASDVTIDWAPRALLSRSVHIEHLSAATIEVELAPSTAPASPPDSLSLPLIVAVDRADIGRIIVSSGGKRYEANTLSFAYHGSPLDHSVSALSVASEWGRLSGDVSLGAAAPFATQGRLALQGDAPVRNARFDALLAGDLMALRVQASIEAEGAQAKGTLALTPFGTTPWRSIAMEAASIDLARFDARLPKTALAISLDASPEASDRIRGHVTARNATPGALDHDRLPLQSLASQFVYADKEVALEQLAVDLGGAGKASGQGSFGVERSAWQLKVIALDLRGVWSSLRATRLEGSVDARIAGDVQQVRAALRDKALALAFDADVRPADVNVKSFRLTAGKGVAAGKASMERSGAQRFALNASLQALDPAAFGDYPAASLSGAVSAQGALKPQWSAAIDARLADPSRWRGVPLTGQARMNVTPQRVRDADVLVTIGPNRIHVSGGFGQPGDALDYAVEAPNLAVLAKALPQFPIAGKFASTGRIGGTRETPSLTFSLTGDSLAWGTQYRVGQLSASGNAEMARGGARPLRVDAKATAVRITNLAFDRVEASIDGSLNEHRARIALHGEDVDLITRLRGSLQGDAPALRWRGQVQDLSNRGKYPLALSSTADVEWRPDFFRVAQARGTLSGGAFDLRELNYDAGRLSSSGTFSALPAAPLFALGGFNDRVKSTLTLDGDWSFAATPRLNGTLNVARADGDLTPVDWPDLPLGLSALKVTARSVQDRLDMSASMQSRFANAELRANVAATASGPGLGVRNAPLSLSLSIDASSLKPLQAMLGTTALVDGRVRAALSGSGTLEKVRLDGSVDADEVKVLAPQFGVAFEEGRIRARLAGGGVVLQELSFKSGAGRFIASGTLPSYEERLSATAKWSAEQFRVLNRPDARLVVTGGGTLEVEPKGVKLAGSIAADEGFFQFRPSRANALGDDVVVRGRERSATRAPALKLPFAVDLALDFGSKFTFIGEGFDTALSGRLHVTTDGKQPLSAKGSIDAVRGSYAAFGQRLSIERGRVIFDGPVDNPALDLLALRKNLPVEAGVEVTGTVRYPRVQLTSNPPVPDNEKLSWLVLGHGPESGTGADAAALQVAMATLSGNDGGPSFSQRFAKTVGVDEISVRTGNASKTGTASQVVAVSKRLSDNLSLVYEQGLAVTNNAIKIEYSLTPTITLRAEAGAISGVGVYYSRSYE